MATNKDEMVFAIDYGTSNSLINGVSSKRVVPIPMEPKNGGFILRSIMYAHDEEGFFFGKDALEKYTRHHTQGRLLRSIKKFLPDPNLGETKFHNRTYNVVELVSKFLEEMRIRACAHLDQEITKAVIGRPARFSANDEHEKLATDRLLSAAASAGFKDVVLFPEPSAAALSFGEQKFTPGQTMLAVDLGGGTSDFCLVKMGSDKENIPHDILATHGLNIAGDRFDANILQNELLGYFGSDIRYKMPTGNNELKLPRSLLLKLTCPASINSLGRRDVLEFCRTVERWSLEESHSRAVENLMILIEERLGYRLYERIEISKKEMTANEVAPFSFREPPIEIDKDISRNDFAIYSNPLVEQIHEGIEETIRKAGKTKKDIDIVCVTGGTGQIPQVVTMLKNLFPNQQLKTGDHLQSVIHGLALKAQKTFF